MRYTKEYKENSRRKIVDVAAREFLRRGISGFRVEDVMRGAGLTQGAFYGHFSSKEALVKEAVHASAKRSRFSQQAGRGDTLDELITLYLGMDHRNHPEAGGCPTASLIGELIRHPKATREALVSEIETMAGQIETLLPRGKSGASRTNRAYAIISTMIGALQLARVATDAGLSKAILSAAREAAMALAKA